MATSPNGCESYAETSWRLVSHDNGGASVSHGHTAPVTLPDMAVRLQDGAGDRQSGRIPISTPPGADPKWQEKIERARQARELFSLLRKGKPKSFRQAIGNSI